MGASLSAQNADGPAPTSSVVPARAAGPQSELSPRRRRRWLWRVLLVVVLGSAGYAFRGPLLRAVAAYLVFDGPPVAADYVLVQPYGDQRYEHAAALYHAGKVKAVLLLGHYPDRLERIGLMPRFEISAERELTARGIPAEAITLVAGSTRTDWERARGLRRWLAEQPAVRLVLLCDRFGAQKLRYIYDHVLGAEAARRVQVVSLPGNSCDENDWWRHRQGIVDVFDSYINLAYTRLAGEDREEWREWDPAEFGKQLR